MRVGIFEPTGNSGMIENSYFSYTITWCCQPKKEQPAKYHAPFIQASPFLNITLML